MKQNIILVILAVFVPVIFAQAQSYTLLHAFQSNGIDGLYPPTPVIRDAKGKLYGTALGGGHNCGVVYEIDAGGNETILHNFANTDGCMNGGRSTGGLLRDAEGNLYGAAPQGGGGCVDLGSTTRGRRYRG